MNRSLGKLLVAVALLLMVCISDTRKHGSKGNMMDAFTHCAIHLLVPHNLIEQYKEMYFPNDKVTRCYIKCALSKLQLFSEEYGIHVDGIVQMLQDWKAVFQNGTRQDVENCLQLYGKMADSCEWAYYGFFCAVSKLMTP